MIKVGIIGYGLSGRYLQAPFFESNPNFDLKAIVTTSANATEQFPLVKTLKTVDDLINNPEIDLISICSPSETHFQLAQKALLAGKHVLVEKPFTPTFAEAKTLFELAKKVNKIITVFQNRRFDSDFLTIKKVIDSGKLGKLLSYEAHFDRYKPILNPKKWKESLQPANGILYDLGSHLIDQAIVLFGDPEGVSGEKFTQREGSDIDDAFELRLNYGKLKVTLRSSLLVKQLGPKYTLHGTKGSFTKFGMDLQEDHSKEGILPNDPPFGLEPTIHYGNLTTEENGIDINEKIITKKGNWMGFFENLAASISLKTEIDVNEYQILKQIEILESIKKI